MIRYIDADALKKRVEDSNKSAGLHLEDLRKIRRWINTAPSIDIVRCKECKHWDTHTMQFAENNLVIARCKQWLQYSRMNGYCHNGERKESE